MADELVKLSRTLAHAEEVVAPLTVGAVLRRLARVFPESDGEAWDVYGCVAGNDDVPVERVAVALDATVDAVRRAADAGAQLLVTHHPAFLEPPARLAPSPQVKGAGAVLWEAVSRGVALASFHTALDAQPRATAMIPEMLKLEAGAVFQPRHAGAPEGTDDVAGYGRVCVPAAVDALTLGTLASRCTAVFGCAPRVWGDFSRSLDYVVTWAGSLGSPSPAAFGGIDAVVCGEIKYHVALDLAQAGLGVIELGHDVSELPYALLIARALQECGIEQSAIVLLDTGPHWAHPEAIRV